MVTGRFILTSALATLSSLILPAVALAHDIHPYVCGSGTGATSKLVNISGQLCNQISIQPNATALPGVAMINIDSNNKIGANFFYFNYYGTANTTAGPYLFLSGTDSGGSPISAIAPVSAGKIARHISGGGVSYEYSNTTFGLGTGDKVDSVIMQLYPTAKANTVSIGGVHCGGLTFDQFTQTLSECPVGTTLP
jgi:hypothetical protein